MINKKDRTAEQLAQAAGVAAMSSAATQRVDVARLSELLAVIASSNPDRRADYPGGCDCYECGNIFIGGAGHDYCAQCEAKRQLLAMLPEALPALLQQLAELERDNETMRGADYHQAGVERAREEATELLRDVHRNGWGQLTISDLGKAPLLERIAAFLAASGGCNGQV